MSETNESPDEFREIWKRACESGKLGEILDLLGEKLETRRKQGGRKEYARCTEEVA